MKRFVDNQNYAIRRKKRKENEEDKDV